MNQHAMREFESYRKDDHEARAILDSAAAESRSTTAEEDARFEALIASAEAHKVRADKLAAMDEAADSLGSRFLAATGSQTADSATPVVNSGLIANIRAVQSSLRSGGQRLGELVLDLPVNMEQRAIADFSDNGSLYTTDFATQVAVYQRTASPWINLATVIQADNGRPLNIPSLTADPTTYTPGEGTAITEATPTLGSAALTTVAYKALSYISAEAEEDELVGLMPYIARSQGRSIGLAFGSALTTALVAAATNGGTAAGVGGNGTATATFVGIEDLWDLKYSMAVPYRQVGVWVMSNTMIRKTRKFKDSLGQYLWQPSPIPGQPATFDGDPVYEDPYLASLGSASKSVLFGDASAVMVKAMPLRIATSTEFRFNQDQVALKTVYRAGGALPDAAALRYLVSATA